MSTINVLVRLNREDKADIDQIVDKLAKHGLKIAKKLTTTGIVSGSIEESRLPSLRKVQGVAQVRQEGRFQLPPMREDIPQ
jgi:hypothetical protein